MMEKLTARSFCEFSIFTFLSFAKVLSISSESVTENIIDVMQNDLKQCDFPQFVYENNIIKNCSKLKYPDKNKTSDIKNDPNTFLCLAFYDIWYQICTYSISNQVSYDNIKFESKIQEFFPEKDDRHVTMFCESIKNISFSYKKLKPFLSPIHFNKPIVCYSTCFDITEKFNPLCALLAWSKSIDENIKSDNKTEHTQVPNSTVNIKLQQPNTLNSGISKTTEGEMTNSNAHQIKPILPNSVQTLSQINTKDKSSTRFESVDINKNIVSNNSDESSGNAVIKGMNNGENKKDINDIRTSTISENTQDHENSVNQEDWNNIEDEKSPYEPNEGLDGTIDIVNHNRNMPEPSERRDIISHYHNIRSDEESHFFTYFTIISLISIAAYIGYHNKQKILAIVLEGRRSRNNRGRRRPSTANYRKLDCTLEEAVTSQCNANVTHVIY